MSEWSPNQVIQGRYRLKSLLGQGGMGSVWVAVHEQLRSEVAVKRLDASIATNDEALERFNREAQALAALRSPNVVQVFDFGVDDGVAFLAMELLRGESLGDRIHRLGRLPIDETVRFLGEVLRAIGKAHSAGVIHRDLKPDNIFICQDDPEFAKVLDFGVAKISSESQIGVSSQTRTGAIIGTPFYMSPEQARGQSIDARSDLWSMGVIAFECLTGQLPFSGDNFGAILVAICTETPRRPSDITNVPAGFDEWFARATDRDRDRRFQSAREMWTELSRLVGAPLTNSVGGAGGAVPERTVAVAGGLTTAQGAATYSTVNRQSQVSDKNRRSLIWLGTALASAAVVAGVGLVWSRLGGQAEVASTPSGQASVLSVAAASTASAAVAAAAVSEPASVGSAAAAAVHSSGTAVTPVDVAAAGAATTRVASPPLAAPSRPIAATPRQPKRVSPAPPAAAPTPRPVAPEPRESGRELTRSFDR